MIRWYKLDKDHNPIEGSAIEGIMNAADRIVAQTVLPDGKLVSTVFLQLDHNYSGTGAPILFETMVFSGEGSFNEVDCMRYSTWDEAVRGHQRMVELHTFLVEMPLAALDDLDSLFDERY